MPVSPPISEDAERRALTDNQAQYLQDYRKALESELSKLTDRAVDRWLADTDKAFRDALKLAIDEIGAQLADELSAALTEGFSGAALSANGGGAVGGGGSQRLARGLTQVIIGVVNESLYEERTRVSQQESERSRAAGEAFRLSRSQREADSARAASRGRRNL